MHRIVTAALSLTLVAACDGEAPTLAPTGHLEVAVAPLELTGLGDACYALTVTNGAGDVVWSRGGVCADRFGDGASSISYVGTCDASEGAAANTVGLVVEALYDTSGAPLATGTWQDPTADGPLERTVTCLPDADVTVDFNLTILRAAQQGFFDVAVTFDDLFCSAKLDCQDDDGALELLFDPATQRRADTAVLAFACTAGADSDTHLHMSDVVVDCGGATWAIDPTAGPGNLSNEQGAVVPNANLFEAAVYRGVEQLGAWNKRYWNVAVGLRDISGCTLTATATASDGPFVDGDTPPNTTWPYVDYDANLSTCTRHALNAPDGVVQTRYTSLAGATFANYFSGTGVFSAAPWWDDAWSHQQALSITAGATALTADSTFTLTFDHTALVSQGLALASGDDLRVLHWDGAAWHELDRVPLAAWNTAATEIAFSPVAPIAAGATDDTYALAYGNPTATSPMADGRNVYWLWEDFDDGDFTTGNAWTVNFGTWNVESGYARMVNPSSSDNFEAGLYYPAGAAWTDYVVTMRIRDRSTGGLSYPGPALRVADPSVSSTTLWWFEYRRNSTTATMRPFIGNNDQSWYYDVTLPTPFPSDAWVDVRYQVVGDRFWSWFEGAPMHVGTTAGVNPTGNVDHHIPQGSIALGHHSNYPAPQEVHYDDVRVWKHLPDPPTLSLGAVTTR